MSFLKPITDRWVDLREKAATLLARLRPGKSGVKVGTTAAKSPHSSMASLAFADPTKALFPGGETSDEPQGTPFLEDSLNTSAKKITSREYDLNERTNFLVERIERRAQGEITLATQSIRFIIGFVWLLTAVWLYLVSNGAITGPAGMVASDAGVLAKTFFTISATGIGVAMAAATMVRATGNSNNKKVRDEAKNLGIFIAADAQGFDDKLTQLLKKMADKGNDPDAVTELSLAHLTALEATTYFHKISFVTEIEGSIALKRFQEFMKRQPETSALESFVLGLFSGALIISLLFVPRPEVSVGTLPDIAKYPWAANLLMFGGILYASIGLLLNIIGGAIKRGVTTKAQIEALDALRVAYTASEAPRRIDVIRRVNDAIQVFRARVGRSSARNLSSSHSDSSAGSYAQEANFASDTGDSDIPAWRKRDSSVKFVDTNFQAAPESWRTDAYAKKFEADQTGKTGSKRSLAKLKNPPRD